LKIGQYFVKLWARVRCLVFLTHSVVGESCQSKICFTFTSLPAVRVKTSYYCKSNMLECRRTWHRTLTACCVLFRGQQQQCTLSSFVTVALQPYLFDHLYNMHHVFESDNFDQIVFYCAQNFNVNGFILKNITDITVSFHLALCS